MFNASRIVKIYGPYARKGSDTPDRPHRLAHILHAPREFQVATPDQLRAVAALAPADLRRSPQSRPSGPRQFPGSVPQKLDVLEFLTRFGIAHRNPVAYDGGWKYVLEVCPFDPQHKAPDAAVFEKPDGALGFKCLHSSCADYHWKDFRDHFEGPRPVRPFVVSRSSAAVVPALEPRDDNVRPELRPVRATAVAAPESDGRDKTLALRAVPPR